MPTETTAECHDCGVEMRESNDGITRCPYCDSWSFQYYPLTLTKQQIKPVFGIVNPMSDPTHTTVNSYGPALLTEEIGEIIIVLGSVLQLIGKAGRFGMDTPGVRDPLTGIVDMTVTPRTKLVEETGDLIAAVDYLCQRGILDIDAVYKRRAHKLRKLLDPNSRDNLGKRLAP